MDKAAVVVEGGEISVTPCVYLYSPKTPEGYFICRFLQGKHISSTRRSPTSNGGGATPAEADGGVLGDAEDATPAMPANPLQPWPVA